MRKNSKQRAMDSSVDGVIVGGADPSTSSISFKNRPAQIIVIGILILLGVSTLIATRASTPSLTKVWSTNADWNSGTLSNVSVNNNVVSLAQKTSATVANKPKGSSTADIASHKPTACSSTASSLHPCSAIDDENASTWWLSSSSDPQWAQIDLGKAYNISEVIVKWKPNYAKVYQIQVSNDGATWQTVYSTTTGTGGIKEITGINATGRYVRMYGTKRATSSGYSLYALKVYGQPTSSSTVNYVTSGTETLGFDATAASQWNSITPVSNLPTGTAISYQYRTSTDNSTWSSWSSTSTIASAPQTRYLQIKATLSTTNTAVTPSLVSLTLSYSSQAAAPVVSLTASPTTIQSGQAATLSWSSQNATTCMASGAWSGAEAVSGSMSTGNLTQTATYTITCNGSGGSATSSTTVTVQPAVVGGGGSSTCTKPTFSSSDPNDTTNTDPNDGHQYWWVNNDAWSGSHGPQTINVCNETSWYAVSNQPDNGGQVETYPDTEYDVGGRATPSTKTITQWNSITSTFSEAYPSAGSWDAAYDLWTNNWSNETMVWNQWTGTEDYWGNCAEPGPNQNTCGEEPSTAATIGGVAYHFMAMGDTDSSGNPIQCTTANESNCELIFFRDSQVSSGSVDILGIYQWEVAHGYAKATDIPTQLEYGVEVCSTSGTETFPMNGLTFTLN